MSASRRRAAATRRAREAVARQRRSERRRRVFVGSGLLAAVLAAATVVVLVIAANGTSTGAPTPQNMASDGVVVGTAFQATRSPAPTTETPPVPSRTAKDGKTVAVQLYVDYLCPNCREFEEANGDYLAGLVESGAATLEIHPIAILDRLSQGSKYSTRSAVAATCVADLQPGSFFRVHQALLAGQPAENTRGLSDAELGRLVTGVEGVSSKSALTRCIDDQRFASWVTSATKRAVKGHFAGTDVQAFPGTPTVIVDGKLWKGEQQFTEFVTTAIGESTTH